jgi:transketolase
MALGMKLDKLKNKVYVIMGDGELAEGQIWEAAMAAAFYKLDNVVGIVDKNGLTSVGLMKDRFDIPNIGDKFKAFGWTVFEIEGHDIEQIMDAFGKADQGKGAPCVIIANTIKGKGVSFAESNASYHNAALNEEKYLKALQEVDLLLEEER